MKSSLQDVEFPSIMDTTGRGRKSYVKYFSDPEPKEKLLKKGESSLVKSIINVLNGPKDSIERLAFESDPTYVHVFSSVYRPKLKLIPDTILKRIAIQDDLVASIIAARSNQISAFGRRRRERFNTGYVAEPNVGVLEHLDPEQKKDLTTRIERAVAMLETCGETKGWSDDDKCSFSRWLTESTRSALIVGRLATEIIWTTDPDSSEKKFHSFRPIDAGTIYKAVPQKAAEDRIRREAFNLLQKIASKKLIPEKFQDDEYAYVQVFEGRPVQAFTAKECVVHNFYPVPDIELDGYPVTPIDTMIAAVTTHINITTHNKLYFQSGRATRGMLVIKSDDVDEGVVTRVKQQFNAAINSVNNAWRMPVFAVGSQDEISWEPIDNSSRDMEFQYLSDMNARVILSAFQISPEELTSYGYLSKGTNNQALSESNNEYKLEAARDIGIRPLIAEFEDFINAVLLPLIDEKLSKLIRIRLVGLDQDNPEKESVRNQQDMPIHMTMDQVLQKVEKKPLGKAWAGEFLINPAWQSIIDKYYTVGEIKEHFFGISGAGKDPALQYFRDSFWFQYQQLMQAQQQAQMQAQQPQQPGAGEESSPGGTNEPQQPGVNDQTPSGKEGQDKPDDSQAPEQATGDLSNSINQAIGALSKSEKDLPPGKRRLLVQQRKVLEQALGSWDEELKQLTKELVDIADKSKVK